jgi:mannosyltransferase OCH1-like enzyme
MNKFGGLYIDLDFLCLRPIDYLLDLLVQKSLNELNNIIENYSIVLTEEWPNSSKKIETKLLGSSETIHNGVLISKKKHPFWLLLVDYCSHQSEKIDGDENSVFSITGTKAIYNVYKKYQYYFNNISVLPNYYLCPIVCNLNDPNLFGFPEQNEYLKKTSEWKILQENIYDIDFIKKSIPWSYSILMSYGSMWKTN